MNDFLKGKLEGINTSGVIAETILQTCFEEEKNLANSTKVYITIIESLEKYAKHVQNELKNDKNATNIANVCISNCINIVKKQYFDVEREIIELSGAKKTTMHIVQTLKKEYETNNVNKIVDRQIGTNPGNPIKDYKENT